MLPQVLPLRRASRELVRELGFLEAVDADSGLSHSTIHALLEVAGSGALPQSELPARLRLDKSTTSRIVAELERRRWLRARAGDDARTRLLELAARGKERLAAVDAAASARVESALATLDEPARATVLRGMELYARALSRSRRLAAYAVRPVARRDRAGVARLIRTVMPEFGATGPGFAILDPEVDDMPATYTRPRSGYFVVVRRDDDTVVGGGGFARLAGADAKTCELRKMYFLPEVRGLGLGQDVLDRCLAAARKARFRTMYLETLTGMTSAQALYERNGFRRLRRPLGDTGHFGCNRFYARKLA
jgi:putative acetyltransferase